MYLKVSLLHEILYSFVNCWQNAAGTCEKFVIYYIVIYQFWRFHTILIIHTQTVASSSIKQILYCLKWTNNNKLEEVIKKVSFITHIYRKFKFIVAVTLLIRSLMSVIPAFSNMLIILSSMQGCQNCYFSKFDEKQNTVVLNLDRV